MVELVVIGWIKKNNNSKKTGKKQPRMGLKAYRKVMFFNLYFVRIGLVVDVVKITLHTFSFFATN